MSKNPKIASRNLPQNYSFCVMKFSPWNFSPFQKLYKRRISALESINTEIISKSKHSLIGKKMLKLLFITTLVIFFNFFTQTNGITCKACRTKDAKWKHGINPKITQLSSEKIKIDWTNAIKNPQYVFLYKSVNIFETEILTRKINFQVKISV